MELIQTNRIHKHIHQIILNRPDKRNALNISLLEQFCAAIESANKDPAIRTIVIGGNGAVFCAGMDLNEAADPAIVHASAHLIAKMFSLLHYSPHVTIASIHGAAVAGGAGIVAACDLALAAEGTKIGFPETRRGLIPAQVLTFLTRQLRQRDLKELVLLGELIDAQKALEIGLVNKVVPIDKMQEEIERYAHMAKACAPNATAETKRLVDLLYPSRLDDDLAKAILYHEKMRGTAEAQEGIRAFNESRAPEWNNEASD
jgi:methylglutaconyl-CoA hydratase